STSTKTWATEPFACTTSRPAEAVLTPADDRNRRQCFQILQKDQPYYHNRGSAAAMISGPSAAASRACLSALSSVSRKLAVARDPQRGEDSLHHVINPSEFRRRKHRQITFARGDGEVGVNFLTCPDIVNSSRTILVVEIAGPDVTDAGPVDFEVKKRQKLLVKFCRAPNPHGVIGTKEQNSEIWNVPRHPVFRPIGIMTVVTFPIEHGENSTPELGR